MRSRTTRSSWSRAFARLFLITFFLAFTWLAAAQGDDAESLSFVVKDARDGAPLTSVTCRVLTADGRLCAFGISDGKGELTVRARRTDTLEFALIGYAKKRIEAKSCSAARASTVSLAEEAVEIREVTVKVPPIRAKSDTITYNVGSFLKRGDVHLDDVLKKLPGISVAKNGTVSYQGKAINKFYIEGRDLLGSSYNQATRNMPADAVSTVEVLENHQPVKMLRGRQHSDEAAINVKLDKGHKQRPFGEIEGGVGGSPAIWSNRLFLTQIFTKDQLLVSGKMNSTGVDLSDETREHIDVTNIDAYEPILSTVFSTSSTGEALPESRYLRNESYAAGANYLIGISDEATLRLNVLLHKATEKHTDGYQYTYGGETPVSLTGENDARSKALTVLPIVKYELNSDKAYLSDELRYSFNRSSTLNTLTANSDCLTEETSSRPSYFQNDLSSAFSFGERIVQFKSLFRYFDRTERLDDASDSVARYNVAERFSSRSLVAKSMVSHSLPLWGNRLRLEAQAYYKDNAFDHDGVTHNKTLRLRFTPTYEVRFASESTLSVDVPFEWIRVSISPETADGDERGRLSILPCLYLAHKFNHKWKVTLSANMGADAMAADFYSPTALRTGYRSSYEPNTKAYLAEDYSATLRLNYRDMARMLFFNATAAYTDHRLEAYASYDYTDTLTVVSTAEGGNHRRILLANAALDKGFPDAGVSIKTAAGYNRTFGRISQSGIMTDNTSNVADFTLSVIYQKFKWFKFNVGATGTLYWEENGFSDSGRLRSLTTNATLQFFMAEPLDVRATFYSYVNETSPSVFKSSSLLDMAATYRIGKRWEVGVNMTNLMDDDEYELTQDSGINTFRSYLPLRGRELIGRVVWRF